MVGWTYIVPWVEETRNTYTILMGDFLEICYLTISEKKGKVMVLWKQ
jgi:hypothetical protein